MSIELRFVSEHEGRITNDVSVDSETLIARDNLKAGEMIGHTPGPWFVTGSMTKYIEARIGGGMLQEVAACGPTESDGGYGETQIANANLIAAAPDLLEALENITEMADAAISTPNPAVAKLLDSARKAIARAKGEA